jgi:hypothetical protein
MTEQANPVIEPDQAAAVYAENLLQHYSFELGGYPIQQLLTRWFDRYPVIWVRLAIVEALYQGRYKAVSVEQILILWQRRGQPCPHFNHEFERLVCNKFPRNLAPPSASASWAAALLSSPVAPLMSRARRDDLRSIANQRRTGSRASRDRVAPEDQTDSAKVTNLLERLDALKQATSRPEPGQTQASPQVSPRPAVGAVPNPAGSSEQPLLKRLQTITECLPTLPAPVASPGDAATPSIAIVTAAPPPYQPSWQFDRESHRPIHKFTPASDTAESTAKLRAVVQPEAATAPPED